MILDLATSYLGTDFTSDYIVPDRVSCAYAVTTILNKVNPQIPIMPSTNEFWKFMQKRGDLFERVYEPVGGDIIINATGTSTLPNVRGHAGIFLDTTRIASNDSASGKWEQNYTRLTWRKLFHEQLKMPTYLFRLKAN